MGTKRRRTHRGAKSDDSDSDDLDGPTVSSEAHTVENRIYLWCNITKQSALDVICKLNKAHLAVSQLVDGTDAASPIYLYINSAGGDLEAAFGVIDAIYHIQRSGGTVVTTVQGTAASAATLISTAGKVRRITKHSTMRVHQLSSGWFGKKGELDDEHSNLNQMETVLYNTYNRQTRMSKKELRRLMERELDLPPDECVAKGLVDEIV